MNTSNYAPTGIATAAIIIATIYNKDPNAEFILIDNSDIDAIVEYFKDHAVYQYCTDLIMDGQLKYKGKPVIAYIGQPAESSKTTRGSMTAEEIKEALNKVCGATKYAQGGCNV